MSSRFRNISRFDVRTIERFLRAGLVDKKEYDKYLKSLEDVSSKAVPIEATLSRVELPSRGAGERSSEGGMDE